MQAHKTKSSKSESCIVLALQRLYDPPEDLMMCLQLARALHNIHKSTWPKQTLIGDTQ